MRDFIDTKLRNVFQDFQKTAEEVGELCACKNLTYEGGNAPNYDDPLIQQNYMLRFFPAYLAEYYLMYQHLLEQNYLQNQLKVISIGCGCGVDMWGLNFAIRDSGGDPNTQISYTGVDITNWRYQDNLDLDNVWFLNQSITDWTELDENDYNVFVFPKCIGELPEDVFESICNIFENTYFEQDRICGLCSLMDQGLDADAARFRRIARIMHDTHGYRCLDDLNEYWMLKGNKGINTVCHQFKYPDNILAAVQNLISNCANYLQNDEPCETDCTSKINRWPILKTSFINYKLLRFERE